MSRLVVPPGLLDRCTAILEQYPPPAFHPSRTGNVTNKIARAIDEPRADGARERVGTTCAPREVRAVSGPSREHGHRRRTRTAERTKDMTEGTNLPVHTVVEAVWHHPFRKSDSVTKMYRGDSVWFCVGRGWHCTDWQLAERSTYRILSLPLAPPNEDHEQVLEVREGVTLEPSVVFLKPVRPYKGDVIIDRTGVWAVEPHEIETRCIVHVGHAKIHVLGTPAEVWQQIFGDGGV